MTQFAALGDIAEFINGAAFKPSDWSEHGTRIIRIQNLNDLTKPFNRTMRQVGEKYAVHPGTLLVSWSASLGVFEWNEPDTALLNQHIFKVIPNNKKVRQDYLRFMLSKALVDMKKHAHGSTMLHVNRGEFLATEIPLPPMKEQVRIAAILEAADAIRIGRREALSLIDRLAQSIFIEMFVHGESTDWPVHSVGEISIDIRTGPFGSQLLHSEFVDNGVAVLGIDNAVQNEFTWSERRYISEKKYNSLRRYTVRPGDVLITIMGTCGRCAVVPDDIPTAINTKHLCCITVDGARVRPEFLHAAFLQQPMILDQLGVQVKGAVMPGLNMGIIKGLTLRIPPIDVQKEFAHRIRAVHELRSLQRDYLSRYEALFESLRHRAFGGQL